MFWRKKKPEVEPIKVENIQGIIDSPERFYLFKVNDGASQNDIDAIMDVLRGIIQFANFAVSPNITIVEPMRVNKATIEEIIIEELRAELDEDN